MNHPARRRGAHRHPRSRVDGRVDFGTGESTGVVEPAAFGIDLATKREQWRESLDAITRMFVEEPFAGYDGKWLQMPTPQRRAEAVQRPAPAAVDGLPPAGGDPGRRGAGRARRTLLLDAHRARTGPRAGSTDYLAVARLRRLRPRGVRGQPRARGRHRADVPSRRADRPRPRPRRLALPLVHACSTTTRTGDTHTHGESTLWQDFERDRTASGFDRAQFERRMAGRPGQDGSAARGDVRPPRPVRAAGRDRHARAGARVPPPLRGRRVRPGDPVQPGRAATATRTCASRSSCSPATCSRSSPSVTRSGPRTEGRTPRAGDRAGARPAGITPKPGSLAHRLRPETGLARRGTTPWPSASSPRSARRTSALASAPGHDAGAARPAGRDRRTRTGAIRARAGSTRRTRRRRPGARTRGTGRGRRDSATPRSSRSQASATISSSAPIVPYRATNEVACSVGGSSERIRAASGSRAGVRRDPRALAQRPESGPGQPATQPVTERALLLGHAHEQQQPLAVPVGADPAEGLDARGAVDAALQALRAEPPAHPPAVTLALEPAVGGVRASAWRVAFSSTSSRPSASMKVWVHAAPPAG